jgi:hypothetical protein
LGPVWDGLSIIFIGINWQRPPNGSLLNALRTNMILLNALFCLQRGIAVWVDSSHAPDSLPPSFVGAAAVPLPSARRRTRVELELAGRRLPPCTAAPEPSRNLPAATVPLPLCAAAPSRARTRRSPPCLLPLRAAAHEPSWSSPAASLRAPPPPSQVGTRRPPPCRLPLCAAAPKPS